MMQQARRPLEPHADRVNKSESNLHYTRGITPKCVTSGGAHLRCFASGQHSSEETSQRWRVVGDTLKFFFQVYQIEQNNYASADSNAFNHSGNRLV